MLRKLILKNRSYRRFRESSIGMETLKDLVDHARLSASAKNLQPIKYKLAVEQQDLDGIFPCLSWAGYLEDWSGPSMNERPSAYIILLEDCNIQSRWVDYDLGIACQSILLAAVEKNLGGCIIAAIRRDQLRTKLNIDDRYNIKLVIALGNPGEEILIDEVDENGDICYFRDEQGRHHVPKRDLSEIIVD